MTKLDPAIPVLRIFVEAKAREFYAEFLGFTVDFEHRFEDNFPIYLSVSQSSCCLHLSEHHGDACPGAHLRIRIDNVEQFRDRLSAKVYKYAKPNSSEQTPWGTTELTIDDPFGNKLTFYQEN